MQNKITFVILHYLTADDTVDCVESINDNVEGTYSIVVVDNGSPNNSFEIVKEKLSNVDNIYFLEARKNLGFANGNNLGYKFAKNKLGSDFIICINNDTEIHQREFLNLIETNYKKYQYDVMGPDILSTRDSGHQNPLSNEINLSGNKLVKNTVKLLLLTLKTYVKSDYKNDGIESNEYYKKDRTMIKLHGAALCFSPSYIKKFETAFDHRTYMYCEEDFLMLRILKNKLVSVYCEEIKIFHKEFSSTMSLCENKTQKQWRFKHWNMCKSTFKLLIAYTMFRIWRES